jgi:hypothetical protein
LKELPPNYNLHQPQEPQVLYFIFAWVLNQFQARWSIPLSHFNFIIMYRPGSQQGRSDALSKRSYLSPKEEDAAYDQQHYVLLKPKQLLLRTMHTTTSMDSTFLMDVCISLLSDPLALKFKQSCTDFRPQNSQIKVPTSQIPDSKTLDLESQDSLNSNSRIHKSHKGKRPQDDTDPRFQFMDELLYYQRLLYILDGPCRLQVLQSRHDFSTIGPFGFNKTMELIFINTMAFLTTSYFPYLLFLLFDFFFHIWS